MLVLKQLPIQRIAISTNPRTFTFPNLLLIWPIRCSNNGNGLDSEVADFMRYYRV